MMFQSALGSVTALQKLIDAIPAPVFVKDKAHRWVMVNETVLATMGRPREAVIGRADDELFAPEQAAVFRETDDAVLASGETAETEHWLTDAAGRTRAAVVRKTLLRLGPAETDMFLVGVVADVTAYREAAAQNHFLSRHDVLTGLPNRMFFQERLREALAPGREEAAALAEVAVLLIDLDGFKAVNDTHGHAAGDELLKISATRLADAVRTDDVVARLGGDEFGIIMRGGPLLREAAARVGAAICEAIAWPVPAEKAQIRISASVGIAFLTEPGLRPEDLLRQADTAMYMVKRAGRRGMKIYEPAMELFASRQLAADLRRALGLGQLAVHYEPIWRVADDRLTGYEAELRWVHPQHGVVPPEIFMPVAEQSGLLQAFGAQILAAGAGAAARWPEEVRLAVNMSPAQLLDQSLVERVLGTLKDAKVAPSRLEVEVTRGQLTHENHNAFGTLEKLRAAGVRVALDDLGARSAPLELLQSFGFDRLKLDAKLAAALPGACRSKAVVRAVINLGKELGCAVTAGGVAHEAQREALAALGCDEMQGPLFTGGAVAEDVLQAPA